MARRKYHELPEHKRLPFVYIVPAIRTERPEQAAHARGCDCRHCKRYGKMLFQIRALAEFRKDG